MQCASEREKWISLEEQPQLIVIPSYPMYNKVQKRLDYVDVCLASKTIKVIVLNYSYLVSRK